MLIAPRAMISLVILGAVLVASAFVASPADADPTPSAPTPTPSGSGGSKADTPPAPFPHIALSAHTPKVVLTSSIGADAATNAKIAVELAQRLRSANIVGEDVMVLPIPLGLNDVKSECRGNGDKIKGIVVALPYAATSGTENFIIFNKNWTQVKFATAIFECGTGDDDLSLYWISRVNQGDGVRYGGSLLPLAVLASIYTVVVPSRTFSTVTTRVYPTTPPLPATGAVSQVAQTSTATSNASAASVGTAFLSTFGSANANVGSLGSPDAQTSSAVIRSINDLMRDLREIKDKCPPATAGAPTSVICGW